MYCSIYSDNCPRGFVVNKDPRQQHKFKATLVAINRTQTKTMTDVTFLLILAYVDTVFL